MFNNLPNPGTALARGCVIAIVLSSATPMQRIINAVKSINIDSTVISDAELERRFNVFKSLVQAACQYTPHPYLGQVTLLCAAESPDTSDEWKILANGGLDMRIVPGDHYTMIQEPHVRTVASQLQRVIEDVLL